MTRLALKLLNNFSKEVVVWTKWQTQIGGGLESTREHALPRGASPPHTRPHRGRTIDKGLVVILWKTWSSTIKLNGQLVILKLLSRRGQRFQIATTSNQCVQKRLWLVPTCMEIRDYSSSTRYTSFYIYNYAIIIPPLSRANFPPRPLIPYYKEQVIHGIIAHKQTNLIYG
jgi:hypothetical protein